MPPPGTYIDITTNPFSRTVTQAEFNGGTFGGVANQVWFRLVVASHVALGSATNLGGTFTPDTTFYQSDGTTIVASNTNVTTAMWADLLAAGTFYIKVTKHAGGSSDFDFTTRFDHVPVDGFTIPAGSRLINDDASGFAASVVDRDGVLLGFLTSIPAGELGAMLPDGTSLWHDRFGDHGSANTFTLVNGDFTFNQSVTIPGISALWFPVICANRTYFFVVDGGTGAIYRIDAAGAVSGILATLPISGPTASAMGVTDDGTIAYFVDGFRSVATIQQWDLVNDVALGDLYTAVTHGGKLAVTPNNFGGEFLVLPDGSLVTWFNDGASGDSVLIHISAAGTLLDSKTYSSTTGFTANQGALIDHLAIGPDVGSVDVWLLEYPFFYTGHFATVDLATGTESHVFTRELFSAGLSLLEDPNVTDIIGPSASCTSLTFLVGSPGGGGLVTGVIGPILWWRFARRTP